MPVNGGSYTEHHATCRFVYYVKMRATSSSVGKLWEINVRARYHGKGGEGVTIHSGIFHVYVNSWPPRIRKYVRKKLSATWLCSCLFWY